MNVSPQELETQGQECLLQALKSGVVPDDQLLLNLGLFITRQTWGRFLFMMEIYKLIVPVHGSVMEFGVRWGQNMALFTSFRGVFEPHNYNRSIIGFDTFEGFPNVSRKDGTDKAVAVGEYSVLQGHKERLDAILSAHESNAPIPHIEKHSIIKGDVTKTLDAYLDDHPETIVALAYFDLDLYEPTKHCLERVLSVMPKGGVLAFDELNHIGFPGETTALKELGLLQKLNLRRMPFSSITSYAVLE